MGREDFATCINCIDGRVQKPVFDHIQKKLGVEYIDMITEPGPDAVLSRNESKEHVNSIKERACLSVQAHNSRTVVIAGHYDCAGNPCCKKEHFKQIKRAVETICDWGLGVSVRGLWVNKNFEVEEVV